MKFSPHITIPKLGWTSLKFSPHITISNLGGTSFKFSPHITISNLGGTSFKFSSPIIIPYLQLCWFSYWWRVQVFRRRWTTIFLSLLTWFLKLRQCRHYLIFTTNVVTFHPRYIDRYVSCISPYILEPINVVI